jgi:hypothetical protein
MFRHNGCCVSVVRLVSKAGRSSEPRKNPVARRCVAVRSSRKRTQAVNMPGTHSSEKTVHNVMPVSDRIALHWPFGPTRGDRMWAWSSAEPDESCNDDLEAGPETNWGRRRPAPRCKRTTAFDSDAEERIR